MLYKHWDLCQSNGGLKDRAFRAALLPLEQLNYISLLPRKRNKQNNLDFNVVPYFSIPSYFDEKKMETLIL